MSNTINEYRTGLKLGARSEFLAIGEVTPGHEETLRQTLARHMGDPNITNAINEIGTRGRQADHRQVGGGRHHPGPGRCAGARCPGEGEALEPVQPLTQPLVVRVQT
jgi:hypothetical protein